MSERLELARRAFEVFNESGDLMAVCTEDVEIVPLRAALDGTVYGGREGVEQFKRDSEESWEGLAIEVQGMTELEGRVEARGRLRATARDTGAQVSQDLLWRVSFRDGLISRLETVVGKL